MKLTVTSKLPDFLFTPLDLAVAANDALAVQRELANPKRLGLKDRLLARLGLRPPPLLLAIERANDDIVLQLLDAGHNPNENWKSFAPLSSAAAGNRVGICTELVKRGAQVAEMSRALKIAAYGGNVAIVSLLLNSGVDPNAAVHNDPQPWRWYRIPDLVLRTLIASGFDPPEEVRAILAETETLSRPDPG